MPTFRNNVTDRTRNKYRGKPLSPVTLNKEMASYRAAWNWAALTGLVQGQFPVKGLVHPKTDEKLPCMTWAEIDRRITPGMPTARKADLWDCLELTKDQIDELLGFVQGGAAHGWTYPFFAFSCHTGARRSKLLRVLVSDVDFDAGIVTIREKKRDRKQRTTRRVPLTPFLAEVLKTWLAEHPGGSSLFCHA